MTNRLISRNTKTITFSLPPEMADQVHDVDLSVCPQLRALMDYAKANGCSAAREYVDEAESGRVVDRHRLGEVIEEREPVPQRHFRGHPRMVCQPLHQEARARPGHRAMRIGDANRPNSVC